MVPRTKNLMAEGEWAGGRNLYRVVATVKGNYYTAEGLPWIYSLWGFEVAGNQMRWHHEEQRGGIWVRVQGT